jgi:AcrR family transcriptional regulator
VLSIVYTVLEMCEDDAVEPDVDARPVAGVRARARAALVAEITETARRHLAEQGAAGLSLRAIARDLGMVSSAIYRYFPSRDDLLTALIIEAYDSIGGAAEQADAAVADRANVLARWRAVCHAVRQWAKANPHEYALVYGSPVPGYVAPQATVPHATRVSFVLAGILRDGLRLGPDAAPQPSTGLLTDELLETALVGVPEEHAVRALMAWMELFGIVTFELFGQLVGAVDDADAFFDRCVSEMAVSVGLVGT